MKNVRHFSKAALLLLSMSASLSQAGGLLLYEIGSDNTGLVNAGAAARAQNASTIASNPAGLSYLAGSEITGGAQLLFGDVTYNPDASTNTSGGDGGKVLGVTPGASFFVSHQIDDRWSVGFGSYGDFGLAVDFNNNWDGRYFVQDAKMVGASMVPSVAYKLNDQWSIGVGAKAMYGILQTQLALDTTPLDHLDRNDGQMKYEDTDWGYGGNAGIIYEPQPNTRIGLAYTSEIDLHFKDNIGVYGGDPLLGAINGTQTKLDMTVPQTATLSLYQKLNEKWALLASTNWQDWSEFGEIYADVDNNTLGAKSATVDANFRDTWHLSVGGQYQANEKTLWNMGVAYDSSMVSDHSRPIMLPVQQAWRVGAGATYALNKNTDVNVSWDFGWIGDVEAAQTKPLSGARTSGSFDNAWMQTIGAGATWRF